MASSRDKSRAVFCERLREARQRAGLSQKRLGMLAGLDEFAAGARINRYERAVHEPDFATAQRLAKALGVPLSYFFAADAAEAEWLLAFRDLPPSKRRELLTLVRAARHRSASASTRE